MNVKVFVVLRLIDVKWEGTYTYLEEVFASKEAAEKWIEDKKLQTPDSRWSQREWFEIEEKELLG